MSNKEAAKLIIENIQMLDDSAIVLAEITETFFAEVGEFIEKSVDDFESDWFGNYEWSEKYTIWFIPSIWRMGQDDSSCDIAWYELQWLNKSENIEDKYWLTSLFPTGKRFVGFHWNPRFQELKNKPSRKQWNAFAQEMEINYPQISQLGFKFDAKDGTWCIPFQLDATQVAANYVSETLEVAFTPITDALAKIQEAHPHFVKIIEDAKKAFGGLALDDEAETLTAIEQ